MQKDIQNTIPDMVDRLGFYWKQPNREDVLTDDTYAVMSENDFKCLPDYSYSQPSGVYNGKMWKHKNRDGTWSLHWYTPSLEVNMCKTEIREILVA